MGLEADTPIFKGTQLLLVVPCYNEAKRFQAEKWEAFIKTHPECGIVLVDDGSTDNTLELLTQLAQKNRTNISVLAHAHNSGKAAAVRIGMLEALQAKPEKIGFLDADLSVTPQECLRLSQYITSDITFVFGSRIKKIDNVIQRKWYRFLIGRFIATLISKMLTLPVYDTQCGAKVFATSLVPILFEKPFISQWLFDVELFFRALKHYGKPLFIKRSREIPISQWIDTADSKVPLGYGFSLWFDLLKIYKAYT